MELILGFVTTHVSIYGMVIRGHQHNDLGFVRCMEDSHGPG